MQHMDDATAVAMAEALKHNATLQSFRIYSHCSDASSHVLTDVFEHNVTLQCFCIPFQLDDGEGIRRNDTIRIQRHALTAVARCSSGTGFHCLSEKIFRNKVFTFFLPALCKVKPVEFVNCRNAYVLHSQSKRRKLNVECSKSPTERGLLQNEGTMIGIFTRSQGQTWQESSLAKSRKSRSWYLSR